MQLIITRAASSPKKQFEQVLKELGDGRQG
jgi:hypothetical protein